MTSAREDVQRTLSLIETIKLPHPSGRLLSSFVTEAVDPALAARYVRDRLSAGDAHSTVSDWTYIVESISQNSHPPPPPDAITRRAIIRRDGGKCCVTGKAGTFWDPLQAMPILPVPSGWTTDKAGVFDMFGAFFGPLYRDWWLSYARHPEHMSPFHNHWLIRKSVSRAMARGFIRLDRLQSSMVEFEVNPDPIGPSAPIHIEGARYALLADHSRSGIQKIGPRFVGSHARLCKHIQFLEIAQEIASETLTQPSVKLPTAWHAEPQEMPRKHSTLKSFPGRAILTVWLMFPNRVRIAAYTTLRKLGKLLYGGPEGWSTVQRLPFGLYLKYQGDPYMFRNEFNALQMVRRYTAIPAPEPLDVISPPWDMDDPHSSPRAYLLITRVSGVPLWRCQDVLSDRGCAQIAMDMKDYLSQLRHIPKTANPDMAICNTLGEACRDPRICGEQPVGPFPDEAAFSQMLRFSDDPSRRRHKIVFTHADLNPRNILVGQITKSDGSTDWRVTGIVDWETGGYYPEYWDCTKALFEGFRWTRRYNDLVKEIFNELGDYSREIDIETRSWESGDGV